jgi:hypothetical protein
VDISSALITVREKVKIPAKVSAVYYEMKNYRSWFDEG